MADMKFITTSSNKLPDINIQSGQLIFAKDTRTIYLDTDIRTSFSQIILLANEAQRQALTYPLIGFYFVKNTKCLWEYDSDGWIQISGTISPGSEQVVFGDSLDDFPAIGEANILYVTSDNTYRWLNNKYTKVTGTGGGSEWIII